MTDPRTLLALAGAPLHPSPLDRAALVVIDHQKEYTEGRLPLDGIDAAAAEVGALLALARREGVPVFHIVQHGKAGGLFDPEGPMSGVIPGLEPLYGEATVVKRLPNAFAGTDLHERLTATGRSELIVAGFMTHMCVSSSVRAAFDLGWRVTLVAGATATRALPDPLGGVIPAAAVHRANLAALADRFAVVVADHRAW
ncbi:cysteine hydrolase family protein [Azospirillum sp.]|uniref:cysteine hydrolase family protein n=1 Tax=Azospirillum sp. TaxID=34012 RepID=UPI003D7387EE